MLPEATWMIGNSPKSDINPALQAGLGAVLVPHPHTWVLEHQDLNTDGGRFLMVERFVDLRSHF
jgi:putative hydrolase of the HAD superfamily